MSKWESESQAFKFYRMMRDARHYSCCKPYWSGVQAGIPVDANVLDTYPLWVELGFRDQVYGYEARPYIAREIERYDMHPAIEQVLRTYRPRNGYALLAEWPHTAQGDSNRIAYTQNHEKGERDIQTVTTFGRYIVRHFDIPDHVVRDLAARFSCEGEMQTLRDIREMVRAVRTGPRSCMADSFDIECRQGRHHHPYEVYAPEYGWHMVVRMRDGDIEARTLCLDHGDDKVFVRSYKKSDGYSHSDEGTEAWLTEKGYRKSGCWPHGAQLARIELPDGAVLLPYLDGDYKSVKHVYENESWQLVITHEECEADYRADTTDGRSAPEGEECQDCGDTQDADDMYWAGRWEDRHICIHCCRDNYVRAYGANGNSYLEVQDECVWVEGIDEYYVVEYLEENNIVELANGSYLCADDAVYVESEGQWYDSDDENICFPEDANCQAELERNCWQCGKTGSWWTHGVEPVTTPDGETYHPDEAPETTESNEE